MTDFDGHSGGVMKDTKAGADVVIVVVEMGREEVTETKRTERSAAR